MAASLNSPPKYVATRTRPDLTWSGSAPLEGDLLDAVQAVKTRTEGDTVILGSGDLVRQLMAAGLIDELRLFVHPLLLGEGKRLFGALPAPRELGLRNVAATSKGTLAITYALGPQA